MKIIPEKCGCGEPLVETQTLDGAKEAPRVGDLTMCGGCAQAFRFTSVTARLATLMPIAWNEVQVQLTGQPTELLTFSQARRLILAAREAGSN